MTESALKCPACGFERLDTDRYCLMCGIDFVIYEAEINRQAAIKSKKDEEPPGFINFSGFEGSAFESAEFYSDSDNLEMEYEAEKISTGKCPNCSVPRFAGEQECHACGVVFARLEAKKATIPASGYHEVIHDSGFSRFFNNLADIFTSVFRAVLPFFSHVSRSIFSCLLKASKSMSAFISLNRKKVFISASIVTGFILAVYLSAQGVSFVKKKMVEKKKTDAENRMSVAAEKFRNDPLSIRDVFLEALENDDMVKANVMLAGYDFPNLQYHPVMIMIKNRKSAKLISCFCLIKTID